MKPAWWVAGAGLVVHLVCTTYLWFRYLPETDDELVDLAQDVVPFAALAVVAATAYLLAEGWLATGKLRPLALLPVAVSLALLLTGAQVNYDQVAVPVVTSDLDVRGYKVAFTDDVSFLVFEGRAIGARTYRVWAALHVYVLPMAVAASLWLAFRFVEPATERARALQRDAQRAKPVREAVIRGDDGERRRVRVR